MIRDNTIQNIDSKLSHHFYQIVTVRELLNKLKYTTCGSTNIEKISSMPKAARASMFGLLSQKDSKAVSL